MSKYKIELYLFIFVCITAASSNYIISIYPQTEVFLRYLKLLSDSIVIILGVVNFKRAKNFQKYSIFVFIVISFITFISNFYYVDYLTHLNGVRDILFYLFVFVFINSKLFGEWNKSFVKSMNIFSLLFFFIQIPISISQLITYGGGDKVTGTLSDSGHLSLLCYLAAYYFFHNMRNNGSGIIKTLVVAIMLILPSMINETKISFLLLPLLGFSIIRREKAGMSFIVLPFLLLGCYLLYILYFSTSTSYYSDKSLSQLFSWEFLADYLFSANYNSADISRLGRFAVYFDMPNATLSNLIFGQGYGLFKGQNILGVNAHAAVFSQLIGGSVVMAFAAFFQGGAALLLLLVFYPINYLIKVKRTYPASKIQINLFLFAFYMLLFIYSNPLNDPFFLVFLSYVIIFFKYHNEIEVSKI
jgi:hypothetical protein